MTEALSVEEVDIESIDWIGHATINRSIKWFADILDIELVDTHDDLDYYQGWAARCDEVVFALKHYRGHPDGTTTLYLPNEDPSQPMSREEIIRSVEMLLPILNIDENDLLWMRYKYPSAQQKDF